jgi:hypothetical protein
MCAVSAFPYFTPQTQLQATVFDDAVWDQAQPSHTHTTFTISSVSVGQPSFQLPPHPIGDVSRGE